MAEKRKGNQYPTQSHSIEYVKSKGIDAMDKILENHEVRISLIEKYIEI